MLSSMFSFRMVWLGSQCITSPDIGNGVCPIMCNIPKYFFLLKKKTNNKYNVYITDLH